MFFGFEVKFDLEENDTASEDRGRHRRFDVHRIETEANYLKVDSNLFLVLA